MTGLLCRWACGQTFDVASVKPAAEQPNGMMRVMTRGGPGTDDPGRINYENVALKQILTNAFDVKGYQISGPAWLDSERFDITAKVPPGSTKEQVRVMLQNLLVDRFKLKVHHETKEMASYVLSVGKNGPKMKVSEPDQPKDPDAPAEAPAPLPMGRGPMAMGKDGFPEMPKSRGGRGGPMMMMMPGRAKLECNKCSMVRLTETLANQLDRPVVDMTGLTANYDFTLIFLPEFRNMPGMVAAGRGPIPSPAGGVDAGPAREAQEEAPALLAAVQEQLGLKLDQKKAAVDIVVIDSMEKIPTEN